MTSIIDGMGSCGAALGPLLTGYLSQRAGGFDNVFLMLYIASLAAAALLLRLVLREVRAPTSIVWAVCSALAEVEYLPIFCLPMFKGADCPMRRARPVFASLLKSSCEEIATPRGHLVSQREYQCLTP